MTKRKKSNGDGSKQLLEGRAVQGDDPWIEGAEEDLPEPSLADSVEDPGPGSADEAAVRAEDTAREVSRLLKAIEADVKTHKDKISGVIMVAIWNDGTATHGWTGNFDPAQTAGKLFNLATDFAVFSAMRNSAFATDAPKGRLN